jgi:hypothetical protein
MPNPDVAVTAAAPLVALDRLDVYRVALEFCARGSAFECIGALDVLRARGALTADQYGSSRALLARRSKC